MLKKAYRLTKPRVEYILKKGAKKTNKYFIFLYLSSNTKENHFGVLISSKTLPKATDRNKIRRQIFETIRTGDVNIEQKDVLIIVKPTIKQQQFNLQQLLINELNQLNE
jgi:ribonuclease P protein component